MRDLAFTVGFVTVAVGVCMIAGASTGLTVLIAGLVCCFGAADMRKGAVVSNNFYYGGSPQ